MVSYNTKWAHVIASQLASRICWHRQDSGFLRLNAPAENDDFRWRLFLTWRRNSRCLETIRYSVCIVPIPVYRSAGKKAFSRTARAGVHSWRGSCSRRVTWTINEQGTPCGAHVYRNPTRIDADERAGMPLTINCTNCIIASNEVHLNRTLAPEHSCHLLWDFKQGARTFSVAPQP